MDGWLVVWYVLQTVIQNVASSNSLGTCSRFGLESNNLKELDFLKYKLLLCQITSTHDMLLFIICYLLLQNETRRFKVKFSALETKTGQEVCAEAILVLSNFITIKTNINIKDQSSEGNNLIGCQMPGTHEVGHCYYYIFITKKKKILSLFILFKKIYQYLN